MLGAVARTGRAGGAACWAAGCEADGGTFLRLLTHAAVASAGSKHVDSGSSQNPDENLAALVAAVPYLSLFLKD